MSYNLRQAADVVGVAKSTVLRAIEAGKIPATRNNRDQWLIESVELRRVYPRTAPGNRKLKPNGNQSEFDQRAALWTI